MDATALQRKGYSVAALRALAKKRLPRMVFDMVDGAAGDETTMRRNEAAIAAIEIVPKMLEGAPKRDQSVELFGVKLPSPVIIGPTGLAGLLWPHAELAAARAIAVAAIRRRSSRPLGRAARPSADRRRRSRFARRS